MIIIANSKKSVIIVNGEKGLNRYDLISSCVIIRGNRMQVNAKPKFMLETQNGLYTLKKKIQRDAPFRLVLNAKLIKSIKEADVVQRPLQVTPPPPHHV